MQKTYFFAGISIFFWSTIAAVSKLLLNTLNSYQILMFSSLFAALGLFVVNLWSGKLKLLKGYRLKDHAIILLICSPGTFFYYVFLYSGTAPSTSRLLFAQNLRAVVGAGPYRKIFKL